MMCAFRCPLNMELDNAYRHWPEYILQDMADVLLMTAQCVSDVLCLLFTHIAAGHLAGSWSSHTAHRVSCASWSADIQIHRHCDNFHQLVLLSNPAYAKKLHVRSAFIEFLSRCVVYSDLKARDLTLCAASWR